jgi:1,4-dihydroxy-6-naphthoate synthase
VTATLTIGYSPCPNDTFIFYALIHGRVRVPGVTFQEQLEDVETLNRMAIENRLDLTKISYHALGHLREAYALLRSGGALGRGCGPLIVARPGTKLSDLKRGVIAVPGRLTTAYLLLRLFDPSLEGITVMTFDRIMDAVSKGEVTAGLIIHESRFTYPLYKLDKLLDLGSWWEQHSGLPIPLGGILGRRSLGRDLLLRVEAGIRESVQYAYAHPEEVMDYCGMHSQEMDPVVMKGHIDLYVNDFSLDLGQEGLTAVRRLFSEAEARGIFPASDKPLLAEEE